MGRLALIAGHSLLDAAPGAGFTRSRIGGLDAWRRGGAEGTVLVQRHGLGDYTPAPRIDHARNLRALAASGCDRVVAFGSVGGLRAELGVGTFVCPDDFIALHLGLSQAEGHGGERVPGFDPAWREELLAAWGRAPGAPPLREGGVYWQARGPRFETPAEIRLIAAHADVIGMTIASECILAGELGIAYAAVCVVDNLANGVGEAPLTEAEFAAGKARNRELLLATIDSLLPDLERVAVR